MIRIVFALRRLPTLTAQEFSRYWRDRHAPLVAEHAAALRIRRYEQSRPLDTPTAAALASVRGAPAPFDGIATIWFDHESDIAAAGSTAEGRRAGRILLEDERRFIDLANSPLTVVTDLEIPLA